MMQLTPIRTAIIVIVALLAVLFAIPNALTKEQLAAWPSFLPHQTMTLGLDLQGGSYLLLEVDRPVLAVCAREFGGVPQAALIAHFVSSPVPAA